MRLEDHGVVLLVDTVDEDNDLFPAAAVKAAVEEFMERGNGWVIADYRRDPAAVRGYPEAMTLEGGEVRIKAKLDEEGQRMRQIGCEYALGGVINKSHTREDGVRVITEFQIREVALTRKKTLMKKESPEKEEKDDA